MSKPTTIPVAVALAICEADGPDELLEEFVRVYGGDRGPVEYEAAHGAARRRRLGQAQSLVASARAVAARNGWDWADVVALAQQKLGLDADWRSAEWHRRQALLAEAAARRGAEESRRAALMEAQTR